MGSWRGVGSEALTRRVGEIVRIVGSRLCEPAVRQQLLERGQWSLANGLSGIALALEWLDRCHPSEGWDLQARDYLSDAVSGYKVEQISQFSAGLFGGAAGLGFTTALMSRESRRYRRLLARLHPLITLHCNTLLAHVEALKEIAPLDYDLISGISGIGTYAITSQHLTGDRELTDRCMCCLTSIHQRGQASTAFFTPPALSMSEQLRSAYPDGYVDCGLAHGVPGPLSFCPWGACPGHHHPGLKKAMRDLSDWLLQIRIRTPYGSQWPAAVSKDGEATPARAAWCYGNPGVAQALMLTGIALQSADLQASAVDAFQTVIDQPRPTRHIYSPSFCHGLAGLLQVTLRFANATDSPIFFGFAQELLTELVSLFDAKTRFGFQDVDPFMQRYDKAELLEGAAGILLVLLAASCNEPPSWDRAMLLS